jgi:small subunit ribosomal protein S18
MSEPKTIQRRINFRKANRQMPRRRHDIPADQVIPTNSELLTKFTTETGKILPRRVTGVSATLHRKITNAIKQSRAINLLP